MIKPEQPTNLIGISVVNFTGTPGIITSIGIGSDRPFILWKGNLKPISADWKNIELAIAHTTTHL
jgi:hypothetical protein